MIVLGCQTRCLSMQHTEFCVPTYAGREELSLKLCGPIMLHLVCWDGEARARRSFTLVAALVNLTYSGLCSFFMLGNLLHRAWTPAVSNGLMMTMTSVRLNVMAQRMVRPLYTATFLLSMRTSYLVCVAKTAFNPVQIVDLF